LAISRDPQDLNFVGALGRSHYRLGRFEEAERVFRSLLERQPKRPFTHGAQAQALLAQGRADVALETLKIEPIEVFGTV
jgi:Flp pilus assembly protein TadD